MARVTDPALLAQLNAAPDYNDPAVADAAMVELFAPDGSEVGGSSNKVTDPALLAQLNAAPAAKEKPNFGENLMTGIHTGMTGRGVGIIQTMYDAGKAIGLFDAHPELEAAFKKAAANVEAEGKGTGVGGFIGELAGDPVNWMNPGNGSLIKAGAKAGALSSFTAPSDRDSNLSTRAINGVAGGAVGGATGAAMPLVGKTIAKAGNIAAGVADRVMTAFGSKNAAERIIYANYAEKLLQDGLTPQQVEAAVMKAKGSGLNATLGEATNSRGVLATEKRVAQGSGEGPMRFNENLQERGRTAIPGEIERRAAELIGPKGAVDDAYATAAREGNDTIANSMQPEGGPLAIAPPGGASAQPGLLDELTGTLNGVRKTINDRLLELGPVNNVERKALAQAKMILDNAERRGGSFDSILDAKKQLNDLFIEGADMNSQKQASRYVSQHAGILDDVLEKLAPNTYPGAKTAATSRMAGREMGKAVDEAGVGDVNGFITRMWGSPGARKEFLSKIPAEAQESATSFFDTLERIGRGFGGQQRNVPMASPYDMVNPKPAAINPISMMGQAARAVGDTYLPGLRTAATEASFNPNVKRLTEKMAKDSAKSLVGRQSVIAGANEMASDSTDAGPYRQNDRPQNDFSPVVNSLIKMIGGGDYAQAQKKVRKPLRITISNDPNIGPDGLPRVDLPQVSP